jgi:hypothetical protein
MAEVVHERERLREINVQIKRSRDGTRDLGHLNRVGEPVPEMIGIAAGENLGFVFESPEGAGVDDAVAVALIIVAIRMRGFRETASAGMFYLYRVAGQHGPSLTLVMVD